MVSTKLQHNNKQSQYNRLKYNNRNVNVYKQEQGYSIR